MAQGLDLKQWNGDKSPSMDAKGGDGGAKKTRGVGSRRIFPPQFKLQVLDSYRNDVDCRGNQRATARKYNIHRRQIQKWLQCEENLRTSVEDCGGGEGKPRKRSDSEEEKTEPRLSQNVPGLARLGDAGKTKPENRAEESRNLKRVAQKLYPSLQGIPPVRGEKAMEDGGEGQKYFGGDVGYAFRLPPSPADTRDDNFNKVIRTDDDNNDGPLDLKSKVRSETLPEEFLASNGGRPEADHGPDKLSMGREGEPGSGSGSSSENIGGQKLSTSTLECLVQKYTGDVDGREFYTGGAELLCSRTAESSSLSDVQVPMKCEPVPWKRGPEEPDPSRKKPKTEPRFDCAKSFNPKRKWIEESMQEMLEDASSLPIKQRVKLNLRSLPEPAYASEDCNRVSSNFTIERLCSSEAKGVECPAWRCAEDRLSPPVPLKEERVSDGEDMDVDILSTTPVEKKTFDFSGYGFGKRRSFSVQFKLTVLDAFYNDKDCNKNQRATARKFNINRRQVQKWLSQESDLRSEGSVKNGKYLQRQRLGGEPREAESCTRCPQHCLRKTEVEDPFEKTIEVNVKHCSDNECLSRREKFVPDASKSRLMEGVDFYSKNLFQSDLKTAHFYHNYLFPENNNLIYHDSILGWPNLTTSALAVPNFQYLSTWHHNFDFCPENQKIY